MSWLVMDMFNVQITWIMGRECLPGIDPLIIDCPCLDCFVFVMVGLLHVRFGGKVSVVKL